MVHKKERGLCITVYTLNEKGVFRTGVGNFKHEVGYSELGKKNYIIFTYVILIFSLEVGGKFLKSV